MATVAAHPASHHLIQVVNESNLSKIESFLNDTAYREAIENSSNYNTRLCRERRLRMPFLDSQTGVAQNHSALFMSARERIPGLMHGQVYTYPSKRWRKKRRQYLMHYLHPKRGTRGDIDDGVEGADGIVVGLNDDSKDSVALKDEHSKDAWYYDEQDMLDMDAFEEPDPDSDYDYEESYSSKRRRRRPRGGAHHPIRGHPPSVDSPGAKRTKGGGRGRKKANYDNADSDKPFVCDPKPEAGPATTAVPSGEKKVGKAAQPSPYCDFCLGDARENKKTGGSEELVSCSDCGRSGHPTCLQFTANMIVSVRKYRWQCIECKCCSICGTSDNDDQLLFCDDCDRGYHMYCLAPPLASPPEGSWSCQLCLAEFHRHD
ncbi:zinc finger protein ubi-d4 A isoform X4 [Diprion similis]|uniref:zinc finger protein ubi-d4 A isoform X4 n=1 Tax=Diprion similis TaxID=362088 RepID=UPI001EF75F66|nr:zinc finger protein ubi-d4 A isoform X4 [Diprion similis]